MSPVCSGMRTGSPSGICLWWSRPRSLHVLRGPGTRVPGGQGGRARREERRSANSPPFLSPTPRISLADCQPAPSSQKGSLIYSCLSLNMGFHLPHPSLDRVRGASSSPLNNLEPEHTEETGSLRTSQGQPVLSSLGPSSCPCPSARLSPHPFVCSTEPVDPGSDPRRPGRARTCTGASSWSPSRPVLWALDVSHCWLGAPERLQVPISCRGASSTCRQGREGAASVPPSHSGRVTGAESPWVPLPSWPWLLDLGAGDAPGGTSSPELGSLRCWVPQCWADDIALQTCLGM